MGLLRRNAKERMNFDTFFNHPFLQRAESPQGKNGLYCIIGCKQKERLIRRITFAFWFQIQHQHRSGRRAKSAVRIRKRHPSHCSSRTSRSCITTITSSRAVSRRCSTTTNSSSTLINNCCCNSSSSSNCIMPNNRSSKSNTICMSWQRSRRSKTIMVSKGEHFRCLIRKLTTARRTLSQCPHVQF